MSCGTWGHFEGRGDLLQDTVPGPWGLQPPQGERDKDVGGGAGTNRRGWGHTEGDRNGDTWRGRDMKPPGHTSGGQCRRTCEDAATRMCPVTPSMGPRDPAGDTDPCPVPRLRSPGHSGPGHLCAGPATVVALGHPGGCHPLLGHLSPAEQVPHHPPYWVVIFSWDTVVVTVGTWWQEPHWAALRRGRDDGAGTAVAPALAQFVSPSISMYPHACLPPCPSPRPCPHPCPSMSPSMS